jgi:hypothetical protein
MTSPGIEHTTFRLVTQCLNQLPEIIHTGNYWKCNNNNIPKIKNDKPQKIIKIRKLLETESVNTGESEILEEIGRNQKLHILGTLFYIQKFHL